MPQFQCLWYDSQLLFFVVIFILKHDIVSANSQPLLHCWGLKWIQIIFCGLFLKSLEKIYYYTNVFAVRWYVSVAVIFYFFLPTLICTKNLSNKVINFPQWKESYFLPSVFCFFFHFHDIIFLLEETQTMAIEQPSVPIFLCSLRARLLCILLQHQVYLFFLGSHLNIFI